ncbi:hypothetical protein NDU88_004146 [Pleurodeles waltl]|uniref:Uncharacterized protein n=2 Tax=Pleurodeles waltl TaxID=8319 RepID=A0AAV7NIX7_PLEWA|nr:hypothetical protein NDU88_004146 [Pleurodeles waltl]
MKTENRQLWNLWGFAYNNLQGEHAENLVLKELQQYINVNIPNPREKFKVSFYISYSPCYNCCNEISEFISKNWNKVELDINCAKVYKWNDENIPVGLRKLTENGVSIKIMDKTDYEESFYLFVDPRDSFVPWSGSDLTRNKYTDWLQVQLTERENNCSATNVKETHMQPSGYVKPLPPCDTDHKAENVRNPECTPLAKREDDSGPETPQKPGPARERLQPTAGVKRKLFDSNY